jgi:hypothetical protein
MFIVCYQGGTGGSFIAAALDSVLFGAEFIFDPELGHCHDNRFGKLPNTPICDNTYSFEHELGLIKTTDYSVSRVWGGHYRNLVAIRSVIGEQLGLSVMENIKFIKISVNHTCSDHVFFITSMLQKKQATRFLQNSTQQYVESWYWVENARTQRTTINLSLEDVFTQGLIGKKITSFLTDEEIDRFNQLHHRYLQIQRHLYPDVMAIIS